METVSKKGGRKRGRPPTFSAETLAILKGFWPEATTRRTLQNKAFMQIALKAIGEGKDPAFQWLADYEAMLTGKPKAFRPTILSQLGRLVDPETIRDVATILCREKPRTKEAIVGIRKFARQRKGLPARRRGGQVALGEALLKTIDDYDQRYQTDRALILDALDFARFVVLANEVEHK